MIRFLPLLILTALLFGQDVLILKSGELYTGTFYGKVGEDIVFKVEGETSTKKFSINDVEIIKIKSGELSYPFSVTNSDILILKDGTTYFGEYSKIEGKIVFFKPQDAFAFQPVPVKLIQTLKLKDGHFIIEDGKNSLTLDLAFKAYQKLSTKEKAIYDAKSKNLVKWALYGPTSIIIFMGSTFLHQGLMGGEFWESPIFLAGSSAASLTIPYLFFNREEKFNFPKSILTDSEKEIYKQTYSKKIRERKARLILGSVADTGILVYLMFMNAMSELDFGSGSGTYNGYTPW